MNGIGNGVVQKAVSVWGGRPTRTQSPASSVESAHHTLYLVSFEISGTLRVSLRRFNPIAIADLIAIPFIRQDLLQMTSRTD